MTSPLLPRHRDSPRSPPSPTTDAASFFGASLSSTTSSSHRPSQPPPPDDDVLDMAALSAEFADMSSPTTQSMRIRLRKQKSMRATAAAALRRDGEPDGGSEPPKTEKRLVARVKKNRHAQEARGTSMCRSSVSLSF